MTGGMSLRRVTDFSVDPQYLYYSMDIPISYAVGVVCVALIWISTRQPSDEVNRSVHGL